MSGRVFPKPMLAGLVCLLLPFCLAPMSLAQAGNAIVQGRVLDGTSGKYLKNAVVAVEGLAGTVLTNDYGEYRITGVPAGTTKLRVSYPGLAAQQLAVTAAAGQTVQQDVRFTAPTGQPEGEIFTMDAFTVAARKETDGKIIAINEQRYAVDIKNVVASDEFGDVTEGNVGEFMKYIPGVIVDYNAAAARTISVRGLPPSTTPVSLDGNRMASAASSTPSRTFEFEQVSINNASRVEVSKSATPDRPADTLGGSINMVSKSAFERAKALFSYRTFLSINDTAMTLGEVAIGPSPHKERLIKPGFDFTYIKPVNKNFGLVVTGLVSNNYNPQTLSSANWYPTSAALPAGTPATVTGDNPYMGAYRFQTGPQETKRWSVGLTADWRMTPSDVLSLSAQYNNFDNHFYIVNYSFDAAALGGRVDSYGPTFTNGAPNLGSVYTAGTYRHKLGATWQPNFKFRHTGKTWTIDAGGYYSHADNRYLDMDDGTFNSVSAGMNRVTINFSDIKNADRPGKITVIQNGNIVDPFKLSNQLITVTPWSLNASGWTGQVGSGQMWGTDLMRGGHANFKRELSSRLPVTLKFGTDYRQNVRDIRMSAPVWRYNGPDGIYNNQLPGGDETAAPFVNDTFSATTPPYGWPKVEWPDPRKMYNHFKAHPEQFTEVLTGNYGTILRRVNNSQFISESVTSGYVRADLRLFKDRLLLVGGVRYERTKDRGEGPFRDTNAIYERDASGRLVRDANGRTKLLTTDAAAQVALQYKERAAHVGSTYDGYYPSANATYNVTENFVARASYGRTVGRPDFSNIIPLITVPDLSSTSQTITANNTALKPWQANNYDLSLEYYFKKGGVFSVGAFRKDFSNFFGAAIVPATPALLESYDLDPALFQGFVISTRTNIGSARVTGVEFNYSQQLTLLPDWARGVSVFANATSLHLSGPTTADFNAFVPRNANWGVSLNRPRYTLMLKWIYRADQRLALRTGTGVPAATYQWLKGTLKLDVNAEVRLRKGLALFANARNITDEQYVLSYHNETTPAYARDYNTQGFGVQYAIGLKGDF